MLQVGLFNDYSQHKGSVVLLVVFAGSILQCYNIARVNEHCRHHGCQKNKPQTTLAVDSLPGRFPSLVGPQDSESTKGLQDSFLANCQWSFKYSQRPIGSPFTKSMMLHQLLRLQNYPSLNHQGTHHISGSLNVFQTDPSLTMHWSCWARITSFGKTSESIISYVIHRTWQYQYYWSIA